MINILPLSPWNFSTFFQCPFKFWCQKDPEIKPLPQKENIYAIFGKNLHKIIYNYYLKVKVKEQEKISTDDIHYLIEDVINEQSVILGIDNINKGYISHLRNFEEFEEQRIERGWKILDVEKRIITKGLKGFVDALFQDNDENIIVVDWKTGKWRDEFLMQGYIYKLLSKADEVMFFESLNGFEHKLKEKDLIKGKNMTRSILNQIKQGVNERRRNRFCDSCEYGLYCSLSSLQMKIYEI